MDRRTRNQGAIIRYVPDLMGVEVKFGTEHFVVESFPTMMGRLETADKYCSLFPDKDLPSVQEAVMIRRFLMDINAELKRVDGFLIERECVLWTNNYMLRDCSFHVEEGVVVPMMGGKPYISGYGRHEYRLVRTLK